MFSLTEGRHSWSAIQHRRDHFAVLSIELGAHHDPVTIADRRVNHRIADNLEQEQLAIADELLGEWEDVFNRLLGENRATSSDATNDRNQRRLLARRAALGRDDDPTQRSGCVFLTDHLD